jgi:hypothetical protein
MTFQQAMIVPTMATLGIGALLMAQNLSLMEVGYAAPAAQGAPAAAGTMGAGAGQRGGATADGAGALATPTDASISAEFGPQAGGKPFNAISDTELAHRAVANSGREDPFMALVPPDPGSIVPPPVTFTPVKPIPQIAALPPADGALPRPTLPTVPGTPAKPIKPIIDDLPWAGDKAPAATEPQWLVRGIISTKGERLSLLEGKDETIQARVGDLLPDGSRVEAISSRGVTFVRGGRRFPKQIGGTN